MTRMTRKMTTRTTPIKTATKKTKASMTGRPKPETWAFGRKAPAR